MQKPLLIIFNYKSSLLTSSRAVSGYKRKPFFPFGGRKDLPILYYSLKERLEEKKTTKFIPGLFDKINIGLSSGRVSNGSFEKNNTGKIISKKKDAELRQNSKDCKLIIDLKTVEHHWEREIYLKTVADNNKIFNHLFGDYAYFYPSINLNIQYHFDKETISPVYFGNLLKPKETRHVPEITFNSNTNDYWTLILTNPDGNLFKNDAEIIHWFVGNIPGGKVERGEQIIEYLCPLPFKGTGFHRYVFVLYKQTQKIDFSCYKKKKPCLRLKERTFKTYDFYKEFEDVLTPCGLSWFQADWDSTLTSLFRNTLEMKEPYFKYDFPKPYIAPQKWFPDKRPFNRYMDLHRDPKELQKMMLTKRLSVVHPFKGDVPRAPYPQALPIDKKLPIWIQNEMKEERDGSGKYKFMYRGDDRPYQFVGRPHTVFAWVKKHNL